HAVEEALAYEEGGIDGIILENSGDYPFLAPGDVGFETVATMTAVACAVRDAIEIPFGVILNWNAAIPAMAVAKASGAAFIRVNEWVNAYVSNSGIIEGDSGNILRYRKNIGAENVKILADVNVKHGAHALVADRSISDQAWDAEYYDADVIIVTGTKTGSAAPLEKIEAVRAGTSLPVITGSGLCVENAEDIMPLVDGAIVGTSLKENGVWWGRVQVDRVKELVDKVSKFR
ncbi:MAG TPA: BtpA/SgcQ family protein, partial [Bacillota bacterium]|nr:BtpA/SgcQ family protein [Bacillota bacterium]